MAAEFVEVGAAIWAGGVVVIAAGFSASASGIGPVEGCIGGGIIMAEGAPIEAFGGGWDSTFWA